MLVLYSVVLSILILLTLNKFILFVLGLVLGGWWWICYFVGYFVYGSSILVFDFLVLVGAFSVFGRADTGKPVQIFGYFRIFVLILELLGLI